jgi:anti-anti-sigma regulatory factor/anti-sigma regulatory factor (Ser/Thr protein kinase)
MTAATLTCTVDREAPVGLVRLAGTLDVTTAPAVRATLMKCLAAHPDAIVLDVSRMRVNDDVVLSLFPAMSRHASGWPGTTLALAGPPPELLDALNRMAVCRFLPTFASVANALADDAPASSAPRVREWLEPTPASLAIARSLVDRACRAWDLPQLSEAAQLIVTELVANGVRHARTEMQVSLAIRARYLHIAVRDRSTRRARLVSALEQYAESGRGLVLVEAMAASWGCAPTSDGKAVWATLRLPAAVP